MRFAVLMTALLAATPSLAGQVCPYPPPNLQSGTPNVEARSHSFPDGTKSYTVDIYSAYEPQFQGPGAPWCIRYEAENTSQFDIENFSLPAGPLQADPLPKGIAGRQGVAVTRPPSKKPSVTDTVFYAFKSVVVPTSVYTGLPANSNPARRYVSATANLGDFARSVFDLDVRFAALAQEDSRYRLAEQILVKELAELPVVGADYAGSGTTMNVASKAVYDGKRLRISVGLEIEGSVKEIEAPYILMLNEAKYPDDMLRFIRTPQSFGVPIPRDARVEKEFQADPAPSRHLYVVDQPVTLTRADGGRVCILAPAYSPVPIPSSALSCNLVH